MTAGMQHMNQGVIWIYELAFEKLLSLCVCGSKTWESECQKECVMSPRLPILECSRCRSGSGRCDSDRSCGFLPLHICVHVLVELSDILVGWCM